MMERLHYLLGQHRKDAITESEIEELLRMIETDAGGEQFISVFCKDLETAVNIPSDTEKWAPVLEAILSIDKFPKRKIRLSFYKFAIAASVAGLIAIAGWYIWPSSSPTRKQTIESISILPPQSSKARIRLADGKEILLDSLKNPETTIENFGIVAKDSEGAYYIQPVQNSILKRASVTTVINPRGSKVFGLHLNDGTKVWLNSGSSISYPIGFNGKERIVQVQGEVYFEVAHDSAKPFIVEKGSASIHVTGTHFNARAYDDAPMEVTLMEGKVEVQESRLSAKLEPGEKCVVKENQLSVIKQTDISQVMAWKSGWFEFEKLTLPEILKEVSRWYDVDIEYRIKPGSETYGGRISRNVPLSTVLNTLEASGVRFRMEGRKLIAE